MDRETFDEHVHEALVHLYDLPYLQRSPLLAMLGWRTRDGAGGTALHRTLLETIERLKPPRDVSPDAVAWKTYRSLVLRYVRSLNAGATASELGLSTRQAQRIHLLALKSIATVLWERWQAVRGASGDALSGGPHAGGVTGELELAAAADDDRLLDDELAAILSGDHGRQEAFPSIVRGALDTVGPVAAQRQTTVDLQIDVELAHSIAPHDLTRQALVQLFLEALDTMSQGRLIVTARICPHGASLEVHTEPANPAGLVQLEARPLGRRVRVVERLLGAIGGQLTIDLAAPAFHAIATVPLGTAPVVLAIEDNPQVVQLFRRYLSGSGYRLVHAPDADAALDLARAEKPDLITLDVMMPRRDGWELLQALKVHPDTRAIPVLVCSVLRDRELALALGASDFLPKPVTQQLLLAALQRHLLVRAQPTARSGPTVPFPW